VKLQSWNSLVPLSPMPVVNVPAHCGPSRGLTSSLALSSFCCYFVVLKNGPLGAMKKFTLIFLTFSKRIPSLRKSPLFPVKPPFSVFPHEDPREQMRVDCEDSSF
jgi:hypothetical protein